MHVIIVESPAKCKTINKYLGRGYKVLASFGHVRDLPSKNGSVLPDKDFEMLYEVSSDSTKHIKAITDAVKGADSLILATDPDREGEAISWHVLEVLRQKKAIGKGTQVQRVSFNSITKSAVEEAIANPRQLDMDLVNAQQARRALDYLVGFNLSPVLWRKLPGSRSAGRVQSVALRLICERELEIEAFDSQEYWSIDADFKSPAGEVFNAGLTHLDGNKLEKLAIKDEKSAKEIEKNLGKKDYKIAKIERKEVKRNPSAPFITSTLQQEAARKLNFSARRTMQTAQKLYEGIDIGGETTGLITYMRTDGVTVAPEAINAARGMIEKEYGGDYVPGKPKFYKSRASNAQEAHEAIRPTDIFRKPINLRGRLTDDQYKLYDLIWKRMITSQMESAVLDRVSTDVEAVDGYARFRATGSTIKFHGFLKVYQEGEDDKYSGSGSYEGEHMLPALREGDATALDKLLPEQHFTQPPPRYTEASLVKKLEELGIGRPSTYASIISVLQDRDYVRLEKKRFMPEMRGRLVTSFLYCFFPRYVEYDFTANLEEELDDIAEGKMDWKHALRDFWGAFSGNVDEVMQVEFTQVITELNRLLASLLFPGEGDIEERRKCPTCKDGKLSLKTGKFGSFVGCSNYPDCNYTRQLSGTPSEEDEETHEQPEGETYPKVLGDDSATGIEISLRKGPYGFYVQLGEQEGKKKPKRSAVPKDVKLEDVGLKLAEKLLALPRVVGVHPETGKEIIANNGRYGPYVQHDGKFTSLKEDDVYTVGVNRAVDLIAQDAERKAKKAAGKPAKRTAKTSAKKSSPKKPAKKPAKKSPKKPTTKSAKKKKT